MEVRKNIGVIHTELNVIVPSHMNYGKLFVDEILKCKEKIALIDGVTGEQILFGEMAQLIINTAGALMRLGVKRGDVVAICSENRIEYIITAIAVWCTDGTATLLNAGYSQNEMVHSMNISKPKYVFFSPATYKSYYKTMLASNLIERFFAFGNSVNDPNVTNFQDFIMTHVDIHDYSPPTHVDGLGHTALILYSSGTTGLPKGAKVTHFNLITNASLPTHSSKGLKCLTLAPLSNTVGILCTVRELINNTTIIYLSGFKEDQYLACIEKYKAGFLLVVPPLVVILTKSSKIQNYDVSSVKIIYCGGAPLDIAVINEVKTRFPNLAYVLQGYGMTEAGPLTEETVSDYRTGSVGKPVSGSIFKIVDVETGKTLGANQEGEVCVKGPSIFGGYIGKNISEDLDKDGFFKTGDIGYYDEDGYFYFVDRIKELIKYKAGQVSPSELEGILLQHPGVKDAGVVGLPDPVVGELPTAFVVKKPGTDVSPKEIIDFVAAKVSSWKQLRGGVIFVAEIPKNPSGKILRRKLRDLLKKTKSNL